MHKKNPLEAPCQKFAELHPALAVIEAVMAEQEVRLYPLTVAAKAAERLSTEVDPARWTAQIEEARNDANALARLRVLYDEKALTFLSTYLIWSVARSNLMDGRMKISQAIVDLLIAHDQIAAGSKRSHLKPIMKARAIAASILHRKGDDEDFNGNSVDYLVRIAYDVLVKAFNDLVGHFPKTKSKHGQLYTTDLVVEGRKFQSHLNKDVDLRSLQVVPFVDCVNSTHPASAKLGNLLEGLHDAYRAAYGLAYKFKGEQNGQVNERQHAFRLVQFLHQEGSTDSYHCGGNLEQQVEAQDQRRYDYECHRQLLLTEKVRFATYLEEVLGAFSDSIAETKQLLDEVTGDKRATVDRLMTVKIMMVNCLAADAMLRRYLRDLKEIEATCGNDLSRGAGSRALEARFEEARKHYDFSVKRRLESGNTEN